MSFVDAVSGLSDIQRDDDDEKLDFMQPLPVAQQTLADIEMADGGSLDPGRITQVDVEMSDRVKEAALPTLGLDHNLGLLAVETALAFEEAQTQKLLNQEAEIQGKLETIDQLLALKSKLAQLPKKGTQDLPQEILDILGNLKERGVALWDKKTVSEEERSSLGAAADAQVSQLRTKVQTLFTKLQTIIQNMSSVNEAMKGILTRLERMGQTLTRNQKA